MADVIKLDLPVTDDVILDPDAVLEAARGRFQQLLIAGYQDGQITICATHGSREVLWMLERAKLHLMLDTE